MEYFVDMKTDEHGATTDDYDDDHDHDHDHDHDVK
jgi:hypothetical protein